MQNVETFEPFCKSMYLSALFEFYEYITARQWIENISNISNRFLDLNTIFIYYEKFIIMNIYDYRKMEIL